MLRLAVDHVCGQMGKLSVDNRRRRRALVSRSMEGSFCQAERRARVVLVRSIRALGKGGARRRRAWELLARKQNVESEM
jgi:hypothetical protein